MATIPEVVYALIGIMFVVSSACRWLGRWEMVPQLKKRDARIAELEQKLHRSRAQVKAANRTVDRFAVVLLAHGMDPREVRLLVDEDRVLARPAVPGRAER